MCLWTEGCQFTVDPQRNGADLTSGRHWMEPDGTGMLEAKIHGRDRWAFLRQKYMGETDGHA